MGRETAAAPGLPPASSVLAVCAHPDDETFGLGAVIAGFVARGTPVRLVCLTHGEASTLGRGEAELGAVRVAELRAAADALGIARVDLHAHPDGGLGAVPLEELVAAVDAGAAGGDEGEGAAPADLFLVFDDTGVSGHPDHRRATEAARAAAEARHAPVLAWTVPLAVADRLNAQFGTSFAGRSPREVDLVVAVDRTMQRRAAMRHQSQFVGNEVLIRRLEMLGDREHLRWLARWAAGGRAGRTPG